MFCVPSSTSESSGTTKKLRSTNKSGKFSSRLQLMNRPSRVTSKVSTATQHSLSPPETTEVGSQTKEMSLRDFDREDLLELLREIVVMPRQHLESVMEEIEKELVHPDVSYNRMLKHVHKFSAMEVPIELLVLF